ncbi:MAG: mltG [Nocardioidaceae bacterium]|nr:mltG [Nocardioidaceae bacterium]
MSDFDLRMHHPTHRGPRRAVGRACIPVLIALLVVLGALGVVVWRGADVVTGLFAEAQDYSGQGAGTVRVEVLEGDSTTDIGARLERAGVVASVEAFTDAAAREPRSLSIQPGLYELREQMAAKAALATLVEGEAMIDTSVTVPEGFTVDETIERLAESSELSRQELERATRFPQRLGLPGWANGDLEGYLYPSSYRVDPRTTATDALTRMVAEFSSKADELSLVRRADAMDLAPRQIVTVASLVQAEASRPADFPKVARTIYNRLNARMPLQLDSTVHYATGDDSGDVFTSQQQRDNPSQYNTYRHRGLPPGAINSPGERALRAALDPARGNWKYFVTVNLETGRTLFARSYREHKKNTQKLRNYCASSDQC